AITYDGLDVSYPLRGSLFSQFAYHSSGNIYGYDRIHTWSHSSGQIAIACSEIHKHHVFLKQTGALKYVDYILIIVAAPQFAPFSCNSVEKLFWIAFTGRVLLRISCRQPLDECLPAEPPFSADFSGRYFLL